MTGREPWCDARRRLLDTATSAPWATDPAYPCDIGHPGSEGSEGEWELSVTTTEEPDDAALIVAAVNDYRALLDIAEAAAELVAELDEDVKTWGDDHLPESTEDARRATADALSRAAGSQSVPRP